MIFYVFGVLAGIERNLIRERTVAGLTAARAWGRSAAAPQSGPRTSCEPPGRCGPVATRLGLPALELTTLQA